MRNFINVIKIETLKVISNKSVATAIANRSRVNCTHKATTELK